MPAGYSGTPLGKKLGLRDDMEVWGHAVPDSVRSDIADFARVTWLAKPKARLAAAHLFCRSITEMTQLLQQALKHLDPAGMIWISWPKKASKVATDITEDKIRDVILPLGLVDVKVCAVDAVWSGLKLMIRKQSR